MVASTVPLQMCYDGVSLLEADSAGVTDVDVGMHQQVRPVCRLVFCVELAYLEVFKWCYKMTRWYSG